MCVFKRKSTPTKPGDWSSGRQKVIIEHEDKDGNKRTEVLGSKIEFSKVGADAYDGDKMSSLELDEAGLMDTGNAGERWKVRKECAPGMKLVIPTVGDDKAGHPIKLMSMDEIQRLAGKAIAQGGDFVLQKDYPVNDPLTKEINPRIVQFTISSLKPLPNEFDEELMDLINKYKI